MSKTAAASKIEAKMNASRQAKKAEVDDLKKRFVESEGVIVTHYTGLTVKDMTALRNDLRKEGAAFRVAKNTLVKLALDGTKYARLSDKIKGPVGIATAKDPMAVARVTYNFAKNNDKLVILGGAMGDEALDVEKIKFLALLPTLDQLRGKLVGLLQAPGAQIARVINAYATKDAPKEATS